MASSLRSRDDPHFDRHSIELSVRSSQISTPQSARVKRRFQDILDRHATKRPLKGLPTVNEGQTTTHSDATTPPSRTIAPGSATKPSVVSGDTFAGSRSEPRESFIAAWCRGHDERTPLINKSRTLPADKPLYAHDNPFIRLPALHLHLIWIILESKYANVLLLLLPVAYIAQALHWPSEAILVLNGLPIVPLSLLIALGVEELSAKIGDTFAQIMAYSFGNAGTIIICGILLRRGEVLVVQTSLLGAIVFNLLAVVGFQYLASGIRRSESQMNETAARTHGSALLLSVANIALPAVLRQVQDEDSVIKVSRILAIMLSAIYLLMLVFRLRTHYNLLEGYSPDENEDDTHDTRLLAPIAATTLLTAATAALTVCMQFFVDTLDDVTDHHDISRTFIGFIFLPFVSNAVSHFTDVGDAWANKMDKATSVAIGCSLQISLFILPVTVLTGWAIGRDMTLNFDVFLNASAFIAVLLVNAVTYSGRSNYFEGCLLLNCYIGIAASAFFYPAGSGDGE